MKSSVNIDRAAPLVTRVKTGILKIPIAIIAFIIDGPKIAVSKIAIIRAGNAKIKSFPRIIMSSNGLLALLAANSPRGMPTTKPINVAINATKSEVCAPSINIDVTSRPKWSVPKRWFGVPGGFNFSEIFKKVIS